MAEHVRGGMRGSRVAQPRGIPLSRVSQVDPAPEAEPTLVDGRGAFSTVRARSDSTPRPLRKEDGDV